MSEKVSDKVRSRAEAPVEETWNTADIYADRAAWETDYKELAGRLKEYESFHGHVGDSAGSLFRAMSFAEENECLLARLYSYAFMNSDVDTGNTAMQEDRQRMDRLAAELAQAASFLEPEISEIPGETIRKYLEEEPRLADQKRTLERILKEKEHTRSGEVEEVLASAGELAGAPSDVFAMFNNADMVFPDVCGSDGNSHALTHGRYGNLMRDGDRVLRKNAFETMFHSYAAWKNMLAANFTANIRQNAFYARARRYASSRNYSLSVNEVPESVYDNLIDCVHAALPAMYRYVALRKKILGVEELHMYDVYVPLTENSGKSFTFEEGTELVKKALAPLGEEYASIAGHAFTDRWIDRADNTGKRSGAYSNGVYGVHPYILMNWQGKLEDVFTLIHELGHSMHSYFSDREQTYRNSRYCIFVAETASTCNECLLMRYLLAATTDEKEKMALIGQYLENFKSTVFRQTMFAEFERNMHRDYEAGIPLTADYICSEYKKLNELYFGPDMISDDEIAFEWARIPHFYSPFYVYQYATGFSAAVALSEKLVSGGEKEREDYLGFLKGGCTADPITLLRGAGVDMEKKESVEIPLKLFASLVDEMERLSLVY